LSCSEALQRRQAKKTHRLGGIVCRAAAEFAQNPEIILATCIARCRIGFAGLVRRGNVTALLGGFSRGEIGGNRSRQQKEDDNRSDIRHRGPQLMLAARSKLL
jgi:hypothetical protein